MIFYREFSGYIIDNLSGITRFVKELNFVTIVENFIADIAVAVIFTFVISWLISRWKRPKLKLVLEKAFDKTARFDGIFIHLRNDGRTALKEKEINWHIYFPVDLVRDGEFLEKEKYPLDIVYPPVLIKNKSYVHLRNDNFRAVLPEREIVILEYRFPSSIGLDVQKIYYHFSTILGLYPRRGRKFPYRKIQDKKGNPRFNLLPSMEIPMPKD